MNLFEKMLDKEHEQVVYSYDPATNLKCIIAIHDTTLGPALGGCRMWTYDSEKDALRDALRLSRGMTYKAAAAELNLGGGKAVIIGDPKKDKSEALFRAFGRFVNGLNGRYITAEDMGTSVQDMEFVRMETDYVVGIARALGGSGDPSPVTAYGVYVGMKACVQKIKGHDSLKGMRVAVEGVGHVGSNLVRHLIKEGCRVYFTDIDRAKIEALQREFPSAEYVKPEEIREIDCDIYAPCAMGGVLNDDSISKLKCQIVAGAANNQLEKEQEHGMMLKEKGILYAPDFVINCGGLINVYNEFEGYNQERAIKQTERVYDNLLKIFSISDNENISTQEAANRFAERRIKSLSHLKNIYKGESAKQSFYSRTKRNK